jgi:hypothetical protein
MDSRRRAVRIPVDQPVELTILGEHEIQLSARIKDVSIRGVGILVPAPVEPGSAVEIATGDSVFLGEVVHCRAIEQGYFIGIELSQVLKGLAALCKMASAYERELHPQASR